MDPRDETGRTGAAVRAATAISVALLLLVVAASPASAQDTARYTVQLQEDGDAVFTVESTLSLESDAERDAFREFADDSTALDAHASSIAQEFRGIVRSAADRTGRNMAVNDVQVDASESGDTGVVTVRFTWVGFADEQGTALVAGDALQDGIRLRTGEEFVLSPPEGYAFRSVPAGAEATDDGLRWTGSGDALTGTVAAAPANGADGQTTPGLAAAAAVGAVGAAAIIRRR